MKIFPVRNPEKRNSEGLPKKKPIFFSTSLVFATYTTIVRATLMESMEIISSSMK